MTRETITLTPEIFNYINEINYDEHEAQKLCREETAEHPRGNLQIAREQGGFMAFMVRLIEARIAVEIGVFTGYSALTTALALRKSAGPGAKMFALDMSHKYIDIAKKYWAMAGVDDVIEPRIGQAEEKLDELIAEGYKANVDFVFIDADKAKYPVYYEKALELLRPGGLMIFDNMLRHGKVVAPEADDKETNAIVNLTKAIMEDPRVTANLVGIGDGLLMARKNK
ncbi:O-methyltransferase [Pseudaquidulcibacter saccharophilus]|uniref:O-methyltransferase n=1 Tax=Pseudaquidulcibacter saccharophilus TaxID=2831900 RepID=UPI001EFF1572|nr:class I SAM-dependent methyltransferase [Pseudaquidulcibacter saccharophilus]